MWRLSLAIAMGLGMPGIAWADPRCARFGLPHYTATRTTTLGAAAPITARVFLAGASLRVESPGPRDGHLVTLMTPDLQAVFASNASSPVAMRMPAPPPTPRPSADHREREEALPGRTLLIQEVRGGNGQWHEVSRVLCRRDGVLLEARQLQAGPAGPVILETRQAEIRMITPDPALFRLPAGFRLVDAPPPPISRRTAPPPG